jgi:hypothetical protein
LCGPGPRRYVNNVEDETIELHIKFPHGMIGPGVFATSVAKPAAVPMAILRAKTTMKTLTRIKPEPDMKGRPDPRDEKAQTIGRFGPHEMHRYLRIGPIRPALGMRER